MDRRHPVILRRWRRRAVIGRIALAGVELFFAAMLLVGIGLASSIRIVELPPECQTMSLSCGVICPSD
jgi:hypothetical protein